MKAYGFDSGIGYGIAEYYSLDGTSFLRTSTTTPDSCIVDENGTWTVDGVVQTQNTIPQAITEARPLHRSMLTSQI